jgi:hypothetical protein
VTANAFLARIVALLDAANIPYMVSGSFASTYHGVPRATQDLDVVIDPTDAALANFAQAALKNDLYVDPDRAREALRQRRQFNVIDATSGWKADLIVRKDRPFSREEFSRRVRARLLDVDVWVATPEDTVLAKLEWSARGGSDLQMADVAGIVRVRAQDLDRDYIRRWAAELGVLEAWERVAGTS